MLSDEFLAAAKDGDLSVLKRLLKTYPRFIEERDGFEMTALHWAAWRGDLPMIEFLLARGVDRSALTIGPPREGWKWETPETRRPGHDLTRFPSRNALCMAYGSGRTEPYRLLLGGAPPPELGAALHVAAVAGDLEWATELLVRGAPVDFAVVEGGRTPLVAAVMNGHTELARLLLRNGADPNRPCVEHGAPEDYPTHERALGWANALGLEELAELLREHGATASPESTGP